MSTKQACLVKGCHSNRPRKGGINKKVSYHQFPSEPSWRSLWLKSKREFKYPPLPGSKLCSEHFTPDCYKNGQSRGILKKYSCPTIFPNSPFIKYTYPVPDISNVVNVIELPERVAEVPKDTVSEDGYSLEHLECSSEHDYSLPKYSWPDMRVDPTPEENRDPLEPVSFHLPVSFHQRVSIEHNYSLPKASILKRKLEYHEKVITRLKKEARRYKQGHFYWKKKVDKTTKLREKKMLYKKTHDSFQSLPTMFKALMERIAAKNEKNVSTRQRYSEELKHFAINLSSYSVKAYLYVRKIFCNALPHPKMIRNWGNSSNATSTLKSGVKRKKNSVQSSNSNQNSQGSSQLSSTGGRKSSSSSQEEILDSNPSSQETSDYDSSPLEVSNSNEKSEEILDSSPLEVSNSNEKSEKILDSSLPEVVSDFSSEPDLLPDIGPDLVLVPDLSPSNSILDPFEKTLSAS